MQSDLSMLKPVLYRIISGIFANFNFKEKHLYLKMFGYTVFKYWYLKIDLEVTISYIVGFPKERNDQKRIVNKTW
jgi:hypothetical protein